MVAIDYITKWFEVVSYKAVTKKVVADFVRDCIVCRFGVPESIITDNATNLNNDLMKAIYETFKIKHRNSKTYRMQTNGAVQAANKNIKEDIEENVVIPTKVEIPSLRIIQEIELSDVEWVQSWYEQLALIDGKIMNA
uniref:Uncharacterized protein K02A2.6-like n=1 Tax=Nicotiana sylvestris TaxID=4096 RepID=A0A1U7USK6_NICSY